MISIDDHDDDNHDDEDVGDDRDLYIDDHDDVWK